MSRMTIKLNHPITEFELDVDENSLHFLWIPVTERLPEHSGFYIIFQVGGSYGQLSEIKIAYWDSRNFDGGMMTTHWMPLPQPPKENKE